MCFDDIQIGQGYVINRTGSHFAARTKVTCRDKHKYPVGGNQVLVCNSVLNDDQA